MDPRRARRFPPITRVASARMALVDVVPSSLRSTRSDACFASEWRRVCRSGASLTRVFVCLSLSRGGGVVLMVAAT